MRTPVLLALAAATVVATGAAAVALREHAPARPAATGGEAVFPAVAGKADEVGQMVVARGDAGFTLQRKGEQWVLAARGDYPVRAEQAQKAVSALAGLRLMEPKTAKTELLPRLEVEDPAGKDAKSMLVTLKNKEGAEIGKIVLGKSRPDSLENPRPGIYVRRPGEQRAWLAEGDPRIRLDVSDWIERSIVSIKADRVREVATIAPDRSRLVVSRDKADDKDFKIASLPEGHKIKSQSNVNDLAGTLDVLLIDDVQGATAIPFPATGAEQAEFRTFDGLMVRLTVADRNGEKWVRIEATAEPWRKTEGDKTTMAEPSDEVKKEVADLNARLRNFTFRVSESTAKKIVTRLDDLVEKEEKKS